MVRWILRLIGLRAAKRVFQGGRGRAPLIDLGLGWGLLRDSRVPSRSKIAAFGLGCVLLLFLQVLELPVELLIIALFNVAGIGFNLGWNGVELLAGPVVLASLLIARLAPSHIVEMVRAERTGLAAQPADSRSRGR